MRNVFVGVMSALVVLAAINAITDGSAIRVAVQELEHPFEIPHAVKPGWYLRADSKAVGTKLTDWNMRVGETGARCLCDTGFLAYDTTDDTFTILIAPAGYSDTVGRRFKAHGDACPTGNCAD